jgi:hypothetical protein
MIKPNKIFLFLALIVILTSFSWITSCTHKADLSNMPEICFERDVLNIYANSCAIKGCHDGSGESGRALDNYADISRTVVPYNPDASQSYQAIISTWGEGKMPPDGPLSQDNRTIIRLWIEQGAGNIPCPSSAGKSAPKTVQAGITNTSKSGN